MRRPRGLGLLLAVASTYAATTVLGHRLAQRVDPVALTPPRADRRRGRWSCCRSSRSRGHARADAHLGHGLSGTSLGRDHGPVLGPAPTAGCAPCSGSAATLVEPVSACAAVAALLLGERLWPAPARRCRPRGRGSPAPLRGASGRGATGLGVVGRGQCLSCRGHPRWPRPAQPAVPVAVAQVHDRADDYTAQEVPPHKLGGEPTARPEQRDQGHERHPEGAREVRRAVAQHSSPPRTRSPKARYSAMS